MERRTLKARRAGLVSLLMGLAACADRSVVTGPALPRDPAPNASLRRAAFVLDVDVASGLVRISAPPTVLARAGGSAGADHGARAVASLLAGDAVQLGASNFVASAVGEFVPGRVRVAFDVSITNRLSTTRLIRPTFPPPPPGAAAVVLFPFETVVTTTSGGTSVGGDGTEIIVELPNQGRVVPNSDWAGSPFNFFNDAGCSSAGDDCFPWESFGPIEPGATSESRTIGFDLDPTVANFRTRLIVAADLENAPVPATGGIAGRVAALQFGPMSGVGIRVGPEGVTTTSNGGGAWALSGLVAGAKQVEAFGLPAGCTAAPVPAFVAPNATATADVSVDCTAATGTLSGTVSSSLGGLLSGIVVQAIPNGAAGPPGVQATAGSYVIPDVPLGANGGGQLLLSGLPVACTSPGPVRYGGLRPGSAVTVDITVPCGAGSPPGYNLSAVWGPVVSGQVALTLLVDLSTYDDPAVNGAGPDDIAAIQGTVQVSDPTGRLVLLSCAEVPGSGLADLTYNPGTGTPGLISWLNFVTVPSPQTGVQGIMRCSFTVGAGPPGTAATATLVTSAHSEGGQDLLPRLRISEGNLSLP